MSYCSGLAALDLDTCEDLKGHQHDKKDLSIKSNDGDGGLSNLRTYAKVARDAHHGEELSTRRDNTNGGVDNFRIHSDVDQSRGLGLKAWIEGFMEGTKLMWMLIRVEVE